MIPSPAQRVPATGVELLADHPQQRRLAAAVGADDADALAAPDHQLHVEQDRIVAVADVDALQREHALTAARAGAQRERHPAPLEDRPLDLLHAVDLHLLDARLAGRALVDADVRPVAEAAHRVLQALDLLLLRHVGLALALELQLPRDHVGRVVARPDPHDAVLELGDPRDRRVEQMAVVGDHHDGAVEVVEQRAQPLAARHVQVRLGLVEQQHVRAAAPGRRPARRACAARRRARSSASRAARRRSRARAAGRAPRPRRARRPRRVQRASTRSWCARARVIAFRSARQRADRPSRASAACSSSSSATSSGRAARTVASGSRSSPSTSCGRCASTSPRRRVTVPASGSSSPATIRSSVDLPPPLGPSTPIREPASTSRSSPRRIARPPKDFVRPADGELRY